MPYKKKNPSVGGGYAGKQRERMKQSFPKVLSDKELKKNYAKSKAIEEKAKKELKQDISNKKEVDAVKGGKTSW
tara:strand:+ start:245 stop:466 length:222 start_codon:yes stop_codon:yes gene_type:complete